MKTEPTEALKEIKQYFKEKDTDESIIIYNTMVDCDFFF